MFSKTQFFKSCLVVFCLAEYGIFGLIFILQFCRIESKLQINKNGIYLWILDVLKNCFFVEQKQFRRWKVRLFHLKLGILIDVLSQYKELYPKIFIFPSWLIELNICRSSRFESDQLEK